MMSSRKPRSGYPGPMKHPPIRITRPAFRGSRLSLRSAGMTVKWRARRYRSFARPTSLEFPANAPPPVSRAGAGCPCPISVPRKCEGSRAPTGAGADTPHPVTCLATGPSPGTPEDDRPMTRAGAPLGALLRRSPSGVGPRFRRWCKACPPIVSQLLAGDRCVPGRSPDAARVRGCEPRPRAPHQHEARNCRAPAAGLRDLFSGPASGSSRLHDAS
jgi:hypothetical protein